MTAARETSGARCRPSPDENRDYSRLGLYVGCGFDMARAGAGRRGCGRAAFGERMRSPSYRGACAACDRHPKSRTDPRDRRRPRAATCSRCAAGGRFAGSAAAPASRADVAPAGQRSCLDSGILGMAWRPAGMGVRPLGSAAASGRALGFSTLGAPRRRLRVCAGILAVDCAPRSGAKNRRRICSPAPHGGEGESFSERARQAGTAAAPWMLFLPASFVFLARCSSS